MAAATHRPAARCTPSRFVAATSIKRGSSRNTGKCGANAQEEVRVIPVAVRHALEDFDFVVDPFDEGGAQGMAAVVEDAVEIRGEVPSKSLQGLEAAPHRPAVPMPPEATSRRRSSIAPELFEVVLQYVGDEERTVRGEQFV